MDVSGIGSTHSSFPVKPSSPPTGPMKGAETKPISTSDQLEISSVGRMFEAADRGSDVRAERLKQIKAAIEQGVYDTDDKLEAALGRLLAEIDVEGDDGRAR